MNCGNHRGIRICSRTPIPSAVPQARPLADGQARIPYEAGSGDLPRERRITEGGRHLSGSVRRAGSLWGARPGMARQSDAPEAVVCRCYRVRLAASCAARVGRRPHRPDSVQRRAELGLHACERLCHRSPEVGRARPSGTWSARSDPRRRRPRSADRSNPARGVALPRKVPREHRYLTHEQVHLLAAACGDHDTLIKTLAYTGLRWGEVTGLRVRDVSIQRRRLTVSQNAVLVRGEVLVGTRRRTSVEACRSRRPSPRGRRSMRGKDADDLVFSDPAAGIHQAGPQRHRMVRQRRSHSGPRPHARPTPCGTRPPSSRVRSGANVKAVQTDARARLRGDDPRRLHRPLRR